MWEGDAGAVQAFWDAGRHLRRLLGEGSWGPRGGAYTVRLPLEDDKRRFDEAAGVALGAGPVMARLDAGERALDLFGGGGYLEWCDTLWASTARVRVTSRAVAVALALAALYDELERAEDAIDAARRAASFDPFDEAPQLALLRLLATSGQVDEALRAYKAYRRLLRDELAAEPSPELRALAASLRRQP
ncbi:MAG: bacterial transcriptional activator domain-containing protein [Chloroflexota bacterium]|nr:bacterial transcriptional activator domain-containing protein [Chloroflexota bacterium]